MARGSELDVAVRASIVSMRFGAGMEPMLIAAKLNIDPGTVRTTCFRIKRAAGSEDLPELLSHCRTKARSGRPSVKNAVAASAEETTTSADALPATTSEEASEQPKAEPLADTSPDPFAEHFETTAGPEQDDLTTANTTNTQSESQFVDDNNPSPPITTVSDPALDPQLAANPLLRPEP